MGGGGKFVLDVGGGGGRGGGGKLENPVAGGRVGTGGFVDGEEVPL